MGKAIRIFEAVFGLLLLGIGMFVLGLDHLSRLWQLGGACLFMLLGGNLVWAACRGRKSWLSRVGPLP